MKTAYLDNSMAKLLAECSTKAVLAALAKRGPEPREAMEVGTMFHRAVAAHLTGTAQDQILEQFALDYRAYQAHEHFSPEALAQKPQYHLTNLQVILSQWLLHHPQPQPFPNLPTIPWVEVSFQLPIDTINVGGEKVLVVFTGQLDALGEDAHGDLFVIETKTVGRLTAWWKSRFEGDSQQTGYQWAAEQTIGREVQGSYINAIEVSKLPDSTRTCYRHTYDDIGWSRSRSTADHPHPMFVECSALHAESDLFLVTRSPALLVQWQRDFLHLAKRMVELDQFVKQGVAGATHTRTQGKFNDTCTFCDYRRWCIHSGRSLDFAEAMLKDNDEVREVKVGVVEQ